MAVLFPAPLEAAVLLISQIRNDLSNGATDVMIRRNSGHFSEAIIDSDIPEL
jgi:hypothetical protein